MKQVLFLAVFGVIALTGVYTVITVYDSTLKIGRMNKTPVIRPHEEPQLVMDKRTIAAHKSEALIKVKDFVAVSNEVPEGILLAKGKEDYLTFCSQCHGARLDGLGTVGQSFFPLPADLTGQKTIDLSDQELFTIISYGSKNTPALASSMSIESRQAVILYLRSMQKKAQ